MKTIDRLGGQQTHQIYLNLRPRAKIFFYFYLLRKFSYIQALIFEYFPLSEKNLFFLRRSIYSKNGHEHRSLVKSFILVLEVLTEERSIKYLYLYFYTFLTDMYLFTILMKSKVLKSQYYFLDCKSLPCLNKFIWTA